MSNKSKKDALNNSQGRLERISLAESRDMMYEKFRTNCRVLRAFKGLSGVEAGDKIGLKNGKRVIDLEYGRAVPDLEEIILISKYFEVTMDDLMNKNISYVFN